MSSGGTSSLLHSHADHNMHCVLAGRKDFILIHPKYKDKLAFHSNVSQSDIWPLGALQSEKTKEKRDKYGSGLWVGGC